MIEPTVQAYAVEVSREFLPDDDEFEGAFSRLQGDDTRPYKMTEHELETLRRLARKPGRVRRPTSEGER